MTKARVAPATRQTILALGSLLIVTAGGITSAACRNAAPAVDNHTLIVDQKNTEPAALQDGTPKHPFSSIQQAAAVAQPGDIVSVRAGVYRETITPVRSGENGKPIIYQSAGNDIVIISGADPVAGWKHSPDGLWSAPLAADFYRSTLHYSDQVFIDGKMITLARWPNTGPDIARPTKAETTRFLSKSRSADNWTTATVEDDKLTDLPDTAAVGAEIVVQPNEKAWSWTLSGTVTAKNGKQLTLTSRNDTGKDGDDKRYADHSRYYLQNRRAFLDAPGEWFHDTDQGRLYLTSPDGSPIEQHRVEARKRDYAFDLDGKSYITVKGFHLFACTITTDRQAGTGVEWDEKGNDLYPWRGAGTTAPANHLLLDGLKVRYPSHFTDQSGHFFLQWGQNTGLIVSGSDNTVQNCAIRYSAGNGITLLGRRNKAVNNTIEDVSYNQVDCSGINTGGAADSLDHEIAGNTIRRCGRSGITPRNLKNSDKTRFVARIHHNDISECMLQDFDGGCIYAGGDGTFVRIDHNWCHDVSGFTASGIYPDILTNWIIDHNVIWNVEWGIHLQNNGVPEGNALCYNNTILVQNTSNTPYGPFGFGNNTNHGKGDVLLNNIIVCTNPDKSPGYRPISSGFEEAEIGVNLFCDNIVGSPTDPLWRDSARHDFRLRDRSPGIDRGKRVTSYKRGDYDVPGFNDPVIGNAPDLGAYEAGSKFWTAGSTIPPLQ